MSWITAVAVVALALVAAILVYVTPGSPKVERADVIFIIGPPTAARVALAEQLRAEGVADKLLVVAYENPASMWAIDTLPICSTPYTECASPDPSTTKGEVLLLKDYAARHHVESAIVLTVTPHVARTRYIFDRCYGPGVTVLPVAEDLSPAQWLHHFQYQTAAFAKAWLTPCASAPGEPASDR